LYLEKLKQEYQKRSQNDAQTQSETENWFGFNHSK
jgi:hypothetical protein